MWKKFEIAENNVDCKHPLNDDRKLWFFSDFPHLIKTLRNWVVKNKIFMTPDGGVTLGNWEAVLRAEPPDSPAPRLAHVLSWEHLNPSGFRKMNVPMAFQLFCPQVQVAMALHVKESLPSRLFCNRVDDLITAMMSLTPAGALGHNSVHKKSIADFLPYLKQWEDLCNTSDPVLTSFSAPTLLGLKVTLQATLELFDYLHTRHGYQYLMTCRVNQDVLERFVGLVRAACGCNDHPDARYNISGEDILETLISLKDQRKLENSSRKQEWLDLLDAELNNIEWVAFSEDSVGDRNFPAYHPLLDHDYCISNSEIEDMEIDEERPGQQETQPGLDHNYHIISTSDYVQSYIAGYVARKIGGYTRCQACLLCTRSSHPDKRDEAIKFLSKGYLIYLSSNLFALTKAIEKIVLAEVSENGIQFDTVLKISIKYWQQLERDVAAYGTPKHWLLSICEEISEVVFVLKDIKSHPRLYCRVLEDMSIKIESHDGLVFRRYSGRADSYETVNELLIYLSKLRICVGTQWYENRRSTECTIIINQCDIPWNNYGDRRCTHCAAERRRHQNTEFIREKRRRLKYEQDVKRRSDFKKMKKENSKLAEELAKLKEELENARVALATADERVVEEAIRLLPEAQQEAVRACFAASKCGYGFQEALFECLKEKSSHMPDSDKRGVLLIDEMKLSEGVSFDTKTMTFRGFTDLGDYTPENKKNKVGDHALVLMYQPFRGTWVQTIGCFLSQGSANGDTLHKLLIDAIALMENSGFCIDAIVTDGASWNRSMWRLFNIGEHLDENKSKTLRANCQHPMDENRRLWFLSDFPHLVKTFRNWVVKKKKFTTPDGTVNIQHWRNILINEPVYNSSLKSAPMLSEAHLNPEGYQKMNVPMAFQLFCDKVRVAMKKHTPHGSEASVALCKRVDNLIQAMMSRCPSNALRKDGSRRKAITDFQSFLAEWETECQTSNPRQQCLTNETLLGLKVTLQATIELSDYLYECHNYDYLMTVRLNQDALERFFGIMRSACGCNDHPNALQFAQLYRLLCVYSLAKPPKNSNISGGEILRTLMTVKNVSKTAPESVKEKFMKLLDRELDNIEYGTDDNENILNEEEPTFHDLPAQPQLDHNYTVQNTSDDIQSYVAGYIARKVLRYTKCKSCISHCRSSTPEERDVMIEELSLGYLIYPSSNLFKLTKDIETIVQNIMSKTTVQCDTILNIAEAVHGEASNFVLIGCKEHCYALTGEVIYFYLTIRGHFLANFFNKENGVKKKQKKKYKKLSKMT
ncbi:uncharacterized protein LOC107042082 [Diachasma alloeum]|uniref:uncharacterized protein LOC107042082 n=1 Tax=Diachasma alloeum TaxID=454923 RepID=UPI0007382329|nr:uncharacterized protein LOC107042082 [Diachasma alloeum]